MAQKHGITFTGVDKMQRRMRKVYDDLPRKAAQLGETMAKTILADAMKRTPYEYGTLQASGKIVKGSSEKRGAVQNFMIVFSAKRGNFDYAEIQHENESYNHTYGEHHYLSRAVDAFVGQTAREMLIKTAMEIMRAMRS